MDWSNAYSTCVSMHNAFVKSAIAALEQGFEQTALKDFENAMFWWDCAKRYENRTPYTKMV